MWTGTTYGAAAAMLGEGLVEEGFATAKGIYNATYNGGYWYQTPEAWDTKGDFRAIGTVLSSFYSNTILTISF